MQHLMIDLETLGTLVNAPVLAIGAVYFDLDTGALGDQFYGGIDIADACRYGRPSGDTIRWWMQQGDNARHAAVAGKHPSKLVFDKFRTFCTKSSGDVKPWGNGASFDISILEYAFLKVTDEPAPWKFWNIRDCRTIKEIAVAAPTFVTTVERTEHHALDDAIHQAKWVSHYWRWLREPRPTSAVEPEDLLA